jgi:hypothetical protein
MMTKAGISGAGANSAPGGADVCSEPNPLPAAGDEDFSSVMSQVTRDPSWRDLSHNFKAPTPDYSRYHQEPVENNDDEHPPAPTKATAESSDSDSSSDADKTDSSKTKSSSDMTNNATDPDGSVVSTLLAMMAQLGVPPEQARKLVAKIDTQVKAIVAEEQGAAATAQAVSQNSTTTGDSKTSDVGIALLKQVLANLEAVPDKPVGHAHPKSGTPPKTNPADISPAVEGAKDANTVENETLPQHIVSQVFTPQVIAAANGVSADGTDGAVSRQRMRFTDEKNENAAATGQKVPGARAASSLNPLDAISSASELDGDGSSGKSLFDSSVFLDFTGKPLTAGFEAIAGGSSAPAIDSAATQVERVAHLVNQEVITVRQSGANSLAVSLKVDPHTELFLQLTNHGGQMQASIRFERGSSAALESHWADLQASLARQNVQLQPLEVKPAANTSAFNSNTNSNSQSFGSFGSFSQPNFQDAQRQQQPRQSPSEAPVSAPVKTVSNNSKTKNKTVSRQGWESWA